MSILEEIFAHVRGAVAQEKRRIPAGSLLAQAQRAPLPPPFAAALRAAPGQTPRLIAEIKRRSPSKGLLRADLDPLRQAKTYARGGAAAISVLTEARYFGGSLADLRAVAAALPGKPVLRKDFIFDEYQVMQARAAGASAILLIAAMLPAAQLRDLLQAAAALGLEALVETHTAAEIEAARAAGAALIGVNNRDLHTFHVTLETCLSLRQRVPPDAIFVAESGIHTRQDVLRLQAAGVDAMLIGEALVTAPDPAARLRTLLGLPLEA
ncbi:MAG: indole-3-glycerol phosphate synthase TrpC [Anaerolineales bacterium]